MRFIRKNGRVIPIKDKSEGADYNSEFSKSGIHKSNLVKVKTTDEMRFNEGSKRGATAGAMIGLGRFIAHNSGPIRKYMKDRAFVHRFGRGIASPNPVLKLSGANKIATTVALGFWAGGTLAQKFGPKSVNMNKNETDHYGSTPGLMTRYLTALGTFHAGRAAGRGIGKAIVAGGKVAAQGVRSARAGLSRKMNGSGQKLLNPGPNAFPKYWK